MGIGLRQDETVALAEHDPGWETLAAETITRLWRVFGSLAKDIQHFGSTAVKHMKAKPIIDIVIGVEAFEQLEGLTLAMEQEGFIVEYAMKDFDWHGFRVFADPDRSIRINNIHIVKYNGTRWRSFLCFRDYLNSNPVQAKQYEGVKLRSAEVCENKHSVYNKGKSDFIKQTTRDALAWWDGRSK